MALKLSPRTGPAPVVRLVTETWASKRATVATKRAAGRAWSPVALTTSSTTTRVSIPFSEEPGAGPGTPSSASISMPNPDTLGTQGGACLGEHCLERQPGPGGGGGGDGSLDQGRLAQHHPVTPLVVEHLQGEVGGEDGAAQIHEDDHPRLRPDRFDGGEDLGGVGADRVGRVVDASGGGDGGVTAHLPGQLRGALGDEGAVGDEDEADHGR